MAEEFESALPDRKKKSGLFKFIIIIIIILVLLWYFAPDVLQNFVSFVRNWLPF